MPVAPFKTVQASLDLFELLLYPYNHNTSESTLWYATGNSQVKTPKEYSNFISRIIFITFILYTRNSR
jgi:hypothetical protein